MRAELPLLLVCHPWVQPFLYIPPAASFVKISCRSYISNIHRLLKFLIHNPDEVFQLLILGRAGACGFISDFDAQL